MRAASDAPIEAALAALDSVLAPWSPHYPTPRQWDALLQQGTREILYGGAAGGGKSDWLLMESLLYVGEPGYSALILRRTYADLALPGAIMDRAHEWLAGTDARWNANDKTWTFPSGATLTFGYLEHEKDKFRYLGAEFQFIAFDELTQFSESQYRFLFSRLRKATGSPIPLRMRTASNPGGVGHEWVSKRWALGEHSKQARPVGRSFVPALLEDNPHLDEEYEASLAELDPVTREQLRRGNWNARHTGNVFQRDWFVIRDWDELTRDTRKAVEAGRLRYWDLAATEVKAGKDPDWTAGYRGALVGDVLYLDDGRRTRDKPELVEEFIRQAAQEDGRTVTQWLEEEPGASGKTVVSHYNRNVLPHHVVQGCRPTGNKRARWKPLVAKAANSKVVLIRGHWNTAFLDVAEQVTWEVNEAIHDDDIDAAAGVLEKAEEGDAGWLAALAKG